MYKATHFNKCIFWEPICKPKHILSLRDIFKMHRPTEFKWTFIEIWITTLNAYFNISEKSRSHNMSFNRRHEKNYFHGTGICRNGITG